jgi:hypothetical protein
MAAEGGDGLKCHLHFDVTTRKRIKETFLCVALALLKKGLMRDLCHENGFYSFNDRFIETFYLA